MTMEGSEKLSGERNIKNSSGQLWPTTHDSSHHVTLVVVYEYIVREICRECMVYKHVGSMEP